MSKKGGKPMGRSSSMPMGGGGGGQSQMMRQLQQMQEEMAKAQAALENETVEVTAGGGAVTVVMNGHQKVVSIKIDPEAVDPEDVETLQDMIIAAVNQGVDKSQELASKRMEAVTGPLSGLGLF